LQQEELTRQIMAHADLLYRVSCGLLRRPQDREDAVQSAMEIAWRKAGQLRDRDKLRPWLVRVLINECYAILRRQQREVPGEILAAGETDIPQDAIMLRDALAQLPEKMRLTLVLHYFEGLSVRETAAAMRCPQGTVLSRMQRGRQALKTLLEDNDHE